MGVKGIDDNMVVVKSEPRFPPTSLNRWKSNKCRQNFCPGCLTNSLIFNIVTTTILAGVTIGGKLSSSSSVLE